jgi:glycosyltransferase involved in cell wall biosynthesis
MRRILHVIAYLSKGGASESSLEFAAAAHEPGLEEHEFLALGRVRPDQIEIPSHLTIHRRKGRSLRTMATWVSEQRFSILHWHWWERMSFMYEMAQHGGHNRIITCHVFPAASEYRLGRFELEYSDLVVFDGRDAMEAYSEIAPERKRWVLGAAKLDDYRRPRTRQSDGKIRMGRGSTLNKWKCPKDLVRLVKPIFDAVPEAEFHIFGEGPMRSHLAKEIRRFGLDDKIKLRGWVRDFKAEVANLDIYLYNLPDRSFSSSELNLQGAAAASLPIVLQPSAGTKWMFRDGVDALIARTPTDTVQMAIRLCRDPVLRRALGVAASQKANEEWGIERMVQDYRKRVYPDAEQSPTTRANPSGRTPGTLRRAGLQTRSMAWLAAKAGRRLLERLE